MFLKNRKINNINIGIISILTNQLEIKVGAVCLQLAGKNMTNVIGTTYG